MKTVESAGISDVGRKRKGNEDCLLLDDDLRLYIVADGIGGHRAGEVASRIVVETMRDCMKRFGKECTVEESNEVDEGLSKAGRQLISSIRLANRQVNRLAHSSESYRGMGSTVSAVLLADHSLVAANVGDSPIYLVHDGNIEEISVQHTVLGEQAALYPDANQLLAEMFHHMLTRSMGAQETVQPDVREVRFFKGDIAVLCSDGLSNKVSPEEILEIVRGVTPEKACRRLVDLANDRGGDDNITVVVVKAASEKENKRGVLGKILTGLRALIPQ